MLVADLKKSVRRLKQLDDVESAVQDAAKKEKNDKEFASLVNSFTTSILKLTSACEKLGYDPSNETVQNAENVIETMESTVSLGMVDEAKLEYAKRKSRELNGSLSREWESFHRNKTQGILNKLNTFGGLMQEQDQVQRYRDHIAGSRGWDGLSLADDGVHTRLELLKDTIDEVAHMEERLNLVDEVREFIVLVTKGKARVSDLNEVIVNWIQKEGLNDKFVIGLKSN